MDTRYSSIFAAYGSKLNADDANAKREEVAAAAQEKQALLVQNSRPPNPDELYRNAASIDQGNTTRPDRTMADDLRNLSISQMFDKYGSKSSSLVGAQVAANSAYYADRFSRRSGNDELIDSASSILGGAASSVLGIGAFGAGLVNDNAGAWAAEKVGDLNRGIQDFQSAGLNNRRRASGVINDLDSEDSRKEYEADNGFFRGLRRIGRDAYRAVGNAVDDPMIAADGVSTGVGSLLVGGPLAKGLKAVGGAVLAGTGIAGTKAGAALASFGSKAAMPASIGLMEGGGTYQQTYETAYAQLKDRTDISEERKVELANRAALEAAAIQTPLAAATGIITSKFEASPFHVPTIRSAAGNLLKEGIEEGLQSGTSQYATNQGLKDNVNANQDLTDGVGEQVGLGALYGLGTAGVVQAPGVALRGAVDTAKLTAKTAMSAGRAVINKVVGTVEERNANINAELNAQSPVAPDKMDAVYATAVAEAPEVKASVVNAINSATDVTPEQKKKTVDYVDQFFNDVSFDDTKADSLPEPVANIVRGSTDQFEALKRASAFAVDDAADPQQRLMAALYVESVATKYGPDLVSTIEKIPDEHPALDQLRTYEDVMINLQQDPRIRAAIGAAREFVKQFDSQQISDENIATPEGQQAAQTVVTAVSIDPTRVPAADIDTVLKHSTTGKVQFTPDQQAYLLAAKAMNQAEQEYLDQGGKLNLSNSEIVARNIRSDEKNPNSTGYSAAEHLQRVFTAVRQGQTDTAIERMDEMVNFTQSLQNKVAALNESFESGTGKAIKYEAYNPKTKKFFTANAVYLNGRSVESVQTAQNMALDAKAVAEVQSGLARAFPQLGYDPMQPVALNPEMMTGPADQAVRAYKQRIQSENNAKRTADRFAADPRSAQNKSPEPVQTQSEVAPKSQDASEQKSDNTPSSSQPSDEVAPRTDDTPDTPQVKEDVRSSEPASVDQTPAPQADEVSVLETEQPTVEAPVSSPEVETSQKASEEVEVSEDQSAPSSEPEVEQADDSKTADPVSGIDAAYPNLLGASEGRGRNLFKQAFALPVEAISRLTGVENPIAVMREALSSGAKFRAMAGESAADTKLTEGTAATYKRVLSYAGKIGLAMNQQLNASLKKNEAFINKQADWFTRKEYRAANITDLVDGKLQYNSELQQNAVLAGLQWFLQADQRQRPLSNEDVKKIIGRDPTYPELTKFNQGLYFGGAVIDLTDALVRYWGVKSNPNVGLGITRGVPEGVAKELFQAMEKAGLIKTDSFKIDNKTYKQIIFNTAELFNEDERRALMANPTMIESVAMVEPEQIMYVGAPPSVVPKTQLRNPEVKLTTQQTEMVKKEQATPFHVVPHMLDFLRSITARGAVGLFGHGDIDNQNMNAAHKQALNSVNRTVYAAFESIDAMASLAEQKAADAGVGVTDMPIHYAYEFTSVNRLQMLGKHNPQANKLTREVIMPTRSTVDLSGETEDMGRFWLAIAQAWGEKVHKQQRDVSVTNARKMATGQYAQAVSLLQSWLTQGEVDKGLDENQILELKRAFNAPGTGDRQLKPVAPVAFYAAMEIARFNNMKPEERKAFTTSLYIEADGITDGPMNAMFHTVGGSFTPTWIDILRKGGMYLDKAGATSNDQGNIADLYQVTANAFKEALKQLQLDTIDNTPVQGNLNALIRLSGSLLGDLKYDPETNQLIDVSRGAVKNPLTVVIYGAGDKGIANKITTTLTKAIYERLSSQLQFAADNPKATVADIAAFLYPDMSKEEAQKAYAQHEADISLLTGSRVEMLDGKLTVITEQPQLPKVGNDHPDYEFTKDQLKNMQDNVLSLFVKPLQEGIQANIGETIQGTTMLRQATQIQSIYLQYAYQRAIQKALDKREQLAKTDGSGWIRSDFLSQRELQGVRDELKYLSPFIETGTQNMLISNSERTAVTTNGNTDSVVEFSRALDGSDATGAYISGPKDSGVSGVPKTVIGTGDGQMMQNFSVTAKDGSKHMLIFDGANFSLDQVEDNSRLINEAVHTGWMQNPMGAVSKTFDDFIRLVDLNNIEPDQSAALTFALTGKRGQMKASDIVDQVKELQSNLSNYSQDIQARKNVLARVQMSVDHMASAGAPFVSSNNNESLEGLTTEQAAVRLNQMLMEERAKLKQETPKSAISEASALSVIQSDQLIDLARKSSLKGESRILFAEAAKVARQLGYRIITGSQEQIDAYADENGLKRLRVAPGETVNGYMSTADKAIYLTNPSDETLLHELIHAATIDRVQSYYLEDGKLSAEQTEAVKRIEGLMQEWLGNEDAFMDLNATTHQAAQNARAAISASLRSKSSEPMRRAAALNEFMAWVLSNQNLSQVASLTKVQNPLVRIGKAVMASLKKLIGTKMRVTDDILSNLRFNTHVLMAGSPSVAQVLSDTVLHQSGNFGTNDRLSQISQLFVEKIARNIHNAGNPAEQLKATQKSDEAVRVADEVTASVIANGFHMDMQTQSSFRMMLAGYTADIALDANALSRAQELFGHVSKNLKVEDFMVDPTSTAPGVREAAQNKYDTVLGKLSVRNDEQGRSTLVPTFLALATVDEGFRNILSQMELPKSETLPSDGIDNIATNFASSMMERLNVAMAGERQNSTSVNETLDALVDKISGITVDRTAFIDQMSAPVGNAIDAANNWVIAAMQAMAKGIATKADSIKANSNNKIVTGAADVTRFMAGIFDQETAGNNSVSVMSLLNQSGAKGFLADLMNELIGRTRENKDVYDLIKKVRSVVQALRQQYRENLPDLIKKQFSRELTDAEQTAMYKGFAKTDIVSLRSAYSMAQITDLIVDPSKSAKETRSLEIFLGNKPNGKLLVSKSRQLAKFISVGEVGQNLLRNSHAVANLLNEGVVVDAQIASSLVNTIDHLVSLYALEGLNQTDRNALASLVQTEASGVNFVLSYLEGQRKHELVNATDPRIQNNLYKGYIPSEQQAGVSLIVANDAEFVDLKKRGYERVADYVGADAEYGKAKKGYYFSPLSGRSTYSQGILQTVHATVAGVNAATGFTNSMALAGRITDPAMVQKINKLQSRRPGGNEQLMPVFDELGQLVAYERSMDPAQLERLNYSTDLSKMVGAWRGRQAEEALADQYNHSLIDNLHEMWNKPDTLIRKDEYINVLDKRELAKDPVLADTVRLIPFDTLEYVAEKFGQGKFMVRRDMLNDALGYRQASIGDAWTGTTRWSPEVQKGVQQVLTTVFGADAFKRALQAEKFIQNRVTDARVAIVIKSIVVPVANMAFNVIQLSSRGVPIATTVKSMPKKLAEVNSYTNNRTRQIELEGLLRAAENDPIAQRKLTAEIQSIEDTNRRLTIWPLIEAGEFTSVSDVGLGIEETSLTDGKLNDFIEGLVDKMPEGLKTAGKYAIVSKDTALFKGLQKATQYGDFLAKAVLYDDMTKRLGKSVEETLGAITEEYVNYDRLPGRTRSTLDNMGLLWFWNFKVRSTKVALSMIRNNPVHALLSTTLPTPLIGSVGSPVSDNIINTLFEGRLGNSVGPGQAFRAVHMLPWLNLVG